MKKEDIPYLNKELHPIIELVSHSGPNAQEQLSIIAVVYDQDCMERGVPDKLVHSIIYAVKHDGDRTIPWTQYFYPGQLSREQVMEGVINILNDPNKYNNI